MTEAEWLVCSDPTAMLHVLRGRASDRKARLTSCACCRVIWNSLDPSLRLAVETAEAFADDRTPLRKLEAACKSALRMIPRITRSPVRELRGPWPSAASAVVAATSQVWPFSTRFLEFIDSNPIHPAVQAAAIVATVAARAEGATDADTVPVVECALIRDIFGSPWREIRVAREWLLWNDATIPRIAQSIYDARDFSLLPILADALEDAGCDNADMLNHCRQPSEHVRGCWVVDLLLGKS